MNAAAEKTKHTPGPWTFKTDRITGDNGITAEGTGFFAETFADIRESGENKRDEALANARLIVAAPDMLDLARNIGALDDSLLVSADLNALRATLREFRQHARDVLAKAEG